MPLISRNSTLQQGTGRPAKYGPLPTDETEMYPMKIDEIRFRIKYFKGQVVYMHSSEHINESLGIRVPKPDIIAFIEEMDKVNLVFSCYYNLEEIDALVVTIVASKPESPKEERTFYKSPSDQGVPDTRKSTKAAYDEHMNPIAVKIAPGQWKMGHRIIKSEGRPIEFKQGYNPLRDEYAEEFMYLTGSVMWYDDDEVWIRRNTGPNGERYPEIPEDSIYYPLNGRDPMQFPVASSIRKPNSSARNTEPTYEETSETTAEDIQVQRHYLRKQGRDPDKMGPAYKLPKGVYDLPDDWEDPSDSTDQDSDGDYD